MKSLNRYCNLIILAILLLPMSHMLNGCKSAGNILEADGGNEVAENEPSLADSTEDYFEDVFLRYEDHIYRDNIKTVQLHKAGYPLAAPVIELNTL